MVISVVRQDFWDWKACGGDKAAGAVLCISRGSQFAMHLTTHPSNATIQEWAVDGHIVARKVMTESDAAYWLDADQLEVVRQWRAAQAAEMERVRNETLEYARRTKAEAATRPEPVVSEALAQAAIRHSKRLGRWYDRGRRGSDTQTRLLNLLQNSRKNDE